MSTKDDEIEALEAQIEQLETATRNSDNEGWGEALERSRKNLEQLKQGETTEPSESSESESVSYMTDEMAELEKSYEHAKRGGEGRTSSSEVWSKLAEEKRDELIEAKISVLRDMAEEHDSMSPSNYVKEKEQRDLYSDFSILKAEVEELQAQR